ncbi:Tn7-like element transposition protein TnsE [Jeotgalibacillus malaysiensis]|uniref:Tn7-like element transposition protein TnsE n=1 Tax=Jeotgalibacillus malaysiensis TaxID=1508404 RepID=UPI00384E0691
MKDHQIKLNNWPFKKGERAQLIWISSPFRYEKKVMLHAYFRAKGNTRKVLIDWGTLPALAIQHYYVDGEIKKSFPPPGTEEIDITIHPSMVSSYKKDWKVYGTEDWDISRSFIVKHGSQSYTLPLVEVVRSILAPNRFLLYRLFESNSFPQYFIENYGVNKIHLDFSSQYHRKYTQSNFLYQLVWLLTNDDLRNIFENVAYSFNHTNEMNFSWSFKQPISIKAIIKTNTSGGIVLRVISVKNKQIPYSEISFSHPEVVQSVRSGEAKKYTLHNKKSFVGQQDEVILDEEVDGTTDNFDLIEMDNQKHEYKMMLKIMKVYNSSNKKRDFEDENTLKRYINDEGKRSTADVGGSQITRGIEQQSLMDLQIEGELGGFIKVMRIMRNFAEVKSINIVQGSLKEFSRTKRFVYLSDCVTERKYVIAVVFLSNGRQFNIVEVERDNRSLSILILSSNISQEWSSILKQILASLINDGGTWTAKSLKRITTNGVKIIKAKHSKLGDWHMANTLFNKLNY